MSQQYLCRSLVYDQFDHDSTYMQNEPYGPYAPESIHGRMLVHRIKVQGTCTVAK